MLSFFEFKKESQCKYGGIMPRLNLLLLSTFALIVGVYPTMAAAVGTTPTFVVGICKPGFPNFSNISAAVSSPTVPAGSIVLVCPGVYQEQVHITTPLTLEGISSGDTGEAIVASPAGGLVQNATNVVGGIAAQIFVDNVSGGPVKISNLSVDGSGNAVTSCPPFVIGIFYQNSAGTVKDVTARNQSGSGCGIGIEAEGGSASPAVTIENNTIHDADDTGVVTETYSSFSTALTATIKGNYTNNASQGIVINEGSSNTVSGNVVSNSNFGITAQGGSQGSVSFNTVLNSPLGIQPFADGVSVTFNKVFNSSVAGINLQGTKVATVQNNTVTSSKVGIEFTCFADPNVIHNLIIDTPTGIDQVPGALAVPNTYFSVATIRTGGC
jgi:parallel beta-helix repeat protein